MKVFFLLICFSLLFSWEKIDQSTSRMKTNKGWIVRTVTGGQIGGYAYGRVFNSSMCFVPDEKHEWHIDHD